MNKIIKLITGLCLAVGLLAGCNNVGSSGGATTTPTTTVLVYMIGTDLQSRAGQALGNIVEMESVGSTSNMNVVIQTGGAKESQGAQGINWTHNQRWKVLKDKLKKEDDLGADGTFAAGNMGTESTLTSFLNWGVKAYPADKYIVVLWDHGGGINSGIGSDEITESTIAVNQITNSLSTVATTNNVKFQIIGFDACLMATAEVASAFPASLADYMVASQDVEPGPGWDYTYFLAYVTANPTANGYEVGKAIAKGYEIKMADEAVTLSVVELSKMPAVITATKAFSNAMKSHVLVSNDWMQIAKARSRALDFYTVAIFGYSTDLVDLQQFAGNVVKNITTDKTLNASVDALAAAINDAVKFKVSTQSDDGATGLSVYFPSILSAYPGKDYAVNTVTTGGDPFFAPSYTLAITGLVSSYYDYYFANQAKLIATVTLPVLSGGVYSSVISNDFNYVLAAHQAPACNLFLLGSSGESVVAPCFDAMVRVESFTPESAPTSTVKFNASESWALLESQPFVMIPDLAVAKTNSYNFYMIPVFYPEWDRAGYLQVEQQPNGAFNVTGYQANASVPGKTYPITAGAKFYLRAYAANKDGYEFYTTDKFVTADPKGKLSITSGSMPIVAGNRFAFVVNDLTGAINVSESALY